MIWFILSILIITAGGILGMICDLKKYVRAHLTFYLLGFLVGYIASVIDSIGH